MTGTLLLRLSGPLQSWGLNSKFNVRRTEREPTKSGVIGLLAAAKGYSRDDAQALSPLRALRMGVRVDREGKLLRDYQTVRGYKLDSRDRIKCDKFTGKPLIDDKKTYTTVRYYLADAFFIVGLEGDVDFLKDLEAALKRPAFALFMGRRSCPVTLPLSLGVQDLPLEAALEAGLQDVKKVRIRVETKRGEIPPVRVHDNPLDFNPEHRRFAFRGVREYWFQPCGVDESDISDDFDPEIFGETVCDTVDESNTQPCRNTDHDAMAELMEDDAACI